MRRLLCLLVLLLPTIGWCQWKVEVEWDEMTDRRSATAYTANSDGHRLLFWFPEDGGTRITINLARGQFDFLPKEFSRDQLPIYRVDGEAPVDLKSVGGDLQLRFSERAMGWKVADNRRQLPPSLIKVLSGKRILVRYVDGDGEKHDIVFPLAGADRAYKLAAELQQ